MSIFLSCTARLPEWTAWFNVWSMPTAREVILFTRASVYPFEPGTGYCVPK